MARGKKTSAKAKGAATKTQQMQMKAKLQVANKKMVELKKDAKAKIAAIKAELKVKVDSAQTTAYAKGFADAMKQINQHVQAKTKSMVAIEKRFDKDFAKLIDSAKKASGSATKRATKGAKSSKTVKVRKTTAAKKTVANKKATKVKKATGAVATAAAEVEEMAV